MENGSIQQLLLAGGIVDKGRAGAQQNRVIISLKLGLLKCVSTDEIVNLFAKIEELKQHVPLVGQIFTLSNMFFLTTFLSISFFRETESTHIHNCKLFPHNTTSNFST